MKPSPKLSKCCNQLQFHIINNLHHYYHCFTQTSIPPTLPRHVANPIKYHGFVGKGSLAMRLLKYEILQHCLLRRTKVQCASDLTLPPRTVLLRKERLDVREQDFYEALYTQSQAQFDSYVASNTLVNNYAHIFTLLIRLR